MDSSKNVNISILKKMLEQTLIKVTGQNNTKDAWLSLVKPNDVIGLVPTDHLYPNKSKKESHQRQAMAPISAADLRGSRG